MRTAVPASSLRANDHLTASTALPISGKSGGSSTRVNIGAELQRLCAISASTAPLYWHLEFADQSSTECLVPLHCVAPLAVIVGEALSNAIKHAHPSGIPGRFRLCCKREANGVVLIEASDDGVGLPEGFDSTTDGAHGLRVMRALSEQLGASLTFNSNCLGLSVQLRLPSPGELNSAHDDADQVFQNFMSIRRLHSVIVNDRASREIFQALPAAIYMTDAAGRILFFNEAAADLWGYRPEIGKSEFCGSWKLYWPDGTVLPHDECPMALALREKRPVRGKEAVAERPDGTRILFRAYPTPLFDEAGELIGAVNMLVDVGEQRQPAQHLASIVESSDDAIISKDVNGVIQTWNQGAERLFGYKPEEAIGQSVTMLIPTERHGEEPAILERILRGERLTHYETVRQRKDGTLVDISLTVSPVKNAVGRVVGASKIARDITERRKSETRRDLLLNEMKHRVKNTLATVQSLATQTMRSVSESERQAFMARLRALGDAYDVLTSETWDRALVHTIVDRALEPFPKARCVRDGPNAVLHANKALYLTMALHELATNAVKYGAWSNPTGQVRLVWTIDEGSRLALTWEEFGGPPAVPPKRKGFGTKLIEQTLDDVTFEFLPQGLACSLYTSI